MLIKTEHPSWSVRHLGLYRMLSVSMITGNVMDRYQSIAWELDLPAERSRATACRAIRSEITRQVQEARPLPVLVVDEAQVLHTDLRLVGLTEWRRRLSMAVHASSQRLVVHHHLGGRQRAELDAYLAHRRTAAHPQGGTAVGPAPPPPARPARRDRLPTPRRRHGVGPSIRPCRSSCCCLGFVGLEGNRRPVAQCRVAPAPVVEPLDELEYRQARFGPTAEPVTIQ